MKKNSHSHKPKKKCHAHALWRQNSNRLRWYSSSKKQLSLSLTSSLWSFRWPHQFRHFPRGLGQKAVLGPAGERRPGCHLLLRKWDLNCEWRLSELDDCFSAARHYLEVKTKWQFCAGIHTLGPCCCWPVKKELLAIVSCMHCSDLTKDFYYQAVVLIRQTACRYQGCTWFISRIHILCVRAPRAACEPFMTTFRLNLANHLRFSNWLHVKTD